MSVETLVARAAEAEANLDLVRALDTYEEALKLAPDSLEIAGRLAVLAFRLNMWPMAEKFYAHLITHGIHEMAIITGYAASLREQSKYDEAVDVLKTVLNRRPEEASLWEGLGTVMAAQGDTDNALTFFNEALRLEPDNLHARFNRGCALIDQETRPPAWKTWPPAPTPSMIRITCPQPRLPMPRRCWHPGNWKPAGAPMKAASATAQPARFTIRCGPGAGGKVSPLQTASFWSAASRALAMKCCLLPSCPI
ncbi:MAG: tetratricopeptide repeat protein [Asticcacaulis sp.]|nr:tetratricopeptide repeat protein [Asticcacaulis sp.]